MGKLFYNCEISINGLKIRDDFPASLPLGGGLGGRLGREGGGRVLGVGQGRGTRSGLPPAVPGLVVGLDVGLVNIVAMSDGTEGFELTWCALRRAYRALQAQNKPCAGFSYKRRRKHLKHLIYNDVIKPLAMVETIKLEQLTSKIGHMGSRRRRRNMRTVFRLLKQRYGSRVREVSPHYTSQDCSQCGFRSKKSWSYENGRFGKCPKCGYTADRDVNAARNIASKVPISLEP